MIRGTKNEGISSLSKQRHTGGFLNYTGIQGQSYESIYDFTNNKADERRDEIDAHITTRSDFPSNYFNGTFE